MDPKNIDQWFELLLTELEAQYQSLLQCFVFSENGLGLAMLMMRLSKGIENTKDVKKLFTSVDDVDSVKALLKLIQDINNLDICRKFFSYDFIKPEILAYAKIEIQLDLLEGQAKNLLERKHLAAASAINEINTDLRQLNKQFFVEKKINTNQYKAYALTIINEQKPILEEHRNCNYIIANLVLAVLTFGTALLVHRVTCGNFLFFKKTESAQKAEVLIQMIANNTEFNSPNLSSSQLKAS